MINFYELILTALNQFMDIKVALLLSWSRL